MKRDIVVYEPVSGGTNPLGYCPTGTHANAASKYRQDIEAEAAALHLARPEVPAAVWAVSIQQLNMTGTCTISEAAFHLLNATKIPFDAAVFSEYLQQAGRAFRLANDIPGKPAGPK